MADEGIPTDRSIELHVWLQMLLLARQPSENHHNPFHLPSLFLPTPINPTHVPFSTFPSTKESQKSPLSASFIRFKNPSSPESTPTRKLPLNPPSSFPLPSFHNKPYPRHAPFSNVSSSKDMAFTAI